MSNAGTQCAGTCDAGGALLVPLLWASLYLPNRVDILPEREFLSEFPSAFGAW